MKLSVLTPNWPIDWCRVEVITGDDGQNVKAGDGLEVIVVVLAITFLKKLNNNK